MYDRLLNILNAAGPTRVLLVGDFMLDKYLYGNIDRISPEAPVMVLNAQERQQRPGGAGSVAADLVGLGAEVACVGVVGDDENGRVLLAMLDELGAVNASGIAADATRPTTCKERIIGLAQHRHQQQLMRIDDESAEPVSEATQTQMQGHLDELLDWCDVVCLEDYNKGVLCPAFCRTVIEAARERGKKVLIDPGAVDDYERYRGAYLIKPNRRELALATGRTIREPDDCGQAAAVLTERYDIGNVLVTLDKEGSYLYRASAADDGEVIPTRARNVYDVSGAGDMVLALLGYLAGAHFETVAEPTLSEIAALANVAGGLQVERFGSAGVSRSEILSELVRENRGKAGKLRDLAALTNEVQWLREQKLKIVFTNGCFDLLHSGHIGLLSQAKAQGDILIVGINSDASVRALKGPERPIHNEQERAALLSALEAIDYVTIFDAPTPIEQIEAVSPDILVKGADWTGAVVGQEWVEEHGGKVVLVPLKQGRSTTNIIEKVLEKTGNRNGK